MRQPILVIIAASTLALAGCGQQAANPETKPATPAEVSTNTPPQNAPQVAATATADFSTLKGRWERPDGGYVLEIRDIAADGQAEAGYFNPSPIKVESARASSEGGTLKVFVTLRDVNYPGCTYTLAYDAQSDQLFGKYYQAAAQQTYDIVFARLK
jgi:hypothetical protein